MKSLEQLEREFHIQRDVPDVRSRPLADDLRQPPAHDSSDIPRRLKQPRRIPLLTNILFCIVLFGLLVTGLFYAAGGARGLLGYSYFSVASESMQSEIPRGSLVITKRVDLNDIKVGNDIAFRIDGDVVVTHRVIRIIPNCKNSGERGFETMGLGNPLPDEEPVCADAVIGRVVYHVSGWGDTFAWLRDRWYVLPALLAGLLVLTILSYIIFKPEDKRPEGRHRP
jgi:signal peptidase I